MTILDVFYTAGTALNEGKKAVLAHITGTRGSTPAGIASKMLVFSDGTIFGTVGGGLVEAEVIRDALTVFEIGTYFSKTYSVDHHDLGAGMICGGKVDILIEPLRKEDAHVYRQAAENAEKGIRSAVWSLFRNGETIKKSCIITDEKAFCIPEGFKIESSSKSIQPLDKPAFFTHEFEAVLFDPVEILHKLIIFGGGHVALALAGAAQKCGFSITVVDDREEFVAHGRFPEGCVLVQTSFSGPFDSLEINKSSYIVIVTRGHTYDEEVLEQVIGSGARYIGMIGSKRKVKTLFKNLSERGVDNAKLADVFAPVGLDIGSESVEEIAVSILAEIIKVRRKASGGPAEHLSSRMKTGLPD